MYLYIIKSVDAAKIIWFSEEMICVQKGMTCWKGRMVWLSERICDQRKDETLKNERMNEGMNKILTD